MSTPKAFADRVLYLKQYLRPFGPAGDLYTAVFQMPDGWQADYIVYIGSDLPELVVLYSLN